MNALVATRTYAVLAVVQAGDAIACAVQIAPIKKVLDDVALAEELRPVLPVVKGAAAVGLLSVYRFPRLARLTTLLMTVYFVLAVSFHLRARDRSPALLAAASFLGLYAAMTVKGPSVRA